MKLSNEARLFFLTYETVSMPPGNCGFVRQSAEVMMEPHTAMVAGLRVLARDAFSPHVRSGIPVEMHCIDRRGALPWRG